MLHFNFSEERVGVALWLEIGKELAVPKLCHVPSHGKILEDLAGEY